MNMNIGSISQNNFKTSKLLSREEKTYIKKLFPGEMRKTDGSNDQKKIYKNRTNISLGSSIDIRI